MEKPTLADFPAWTVENLRFDPSDRSFRSWVETNIRGFRSTVEGHAFTASMQEFDAKHKATQQHKEINLSGPSFGISVKQFESVISKIYRSNIIYNKNFPRPPRGGWVTPDNCLERINDLVRTTMICRHIDEPKKVSEQIVAIAKRTGLSCRVFSQAKEEGYYAYHVYVLFPTEVVDRNWNKRDISIEFEIQITT